jgi:hypothetical protein
MKYILIAVFTLVSLNVFAQPSSPDVCLPYDVAKKVTHDLLTGDSAKAVLSGTINELDATKEKLSYKDSLINIASLKETSLSTQVKNEQSQKNSYINLYEDSKKQYTTLRKKLKWYKAKRTFVDIVFTGTIGVLAYVLLTK